jgi:hypothetical protein
MRRCSGNLINQCGTTITLGASGDTINLAAGASQTGFGRTGTVDWDTTAKTATFSAVSGNGYFVNTTAGVITVNLPAGSAGAIVSLADYAATWQTNNLTVSPNGTDKIGGVNTSVTLDTEGQSVTFIYTDSTQGWLNTMDSTSNVRGNPFIVATGGTITCCGDYKIHTFTGPGTFTVTNAGAPTGSDTVDYLVVAGGGSGASTQFGGGGGGAGGFRESKAPTAPWTASPLATCASLPVSIQGYPITVGAGGSQSPTESGHGNPGNNSVFSSITSAAGGAGSGTTINPINSGGSGGGGFGLGGACGPAGSGNTPPVSPPQGQPGGLGGGNAGTNSTGGGGGGATTAGTAAVTCAPPATFGVAGPGGPGATTSISGSPTAYAGGGGGSTETSPGAGIGGSGGTGGGGTGADAYPATHGTAGTANTGGGGGGGTRLTSPASQGYAGGSGIVIIRYKFQ